MKKKTTKKVVRKVRIAKPLEKKEYKVTLSFNNQIYVFETDNLEECIFAAKPFHLKTKIIIKVERNGITKEKFLPGTKGKMLFMNRVYLRTFLRNFFFK